MSSSESSPIDASTLWAPSPGKAAIAALIGGLIGIAIVQSIDPVIPLKQLPELGISASDAEVEKRIVAAKEFYGRNYAINFGIIGSCLGLVFAGVTLPKNKIPGAILAAVLGGGLAATAGYFAGVDTGVEIAWSKDQSLTKAGLFAFSIWASMGVGIALGASICLGNVATLVKSMLGAFIAAILVVVAVILVFSIAFPSSNLSNHLPLSLTERLVWILVSSGAFGATMAMGLKPEASKEQSAVTEKPDETEPTVKVD